MIDKIDKTKVLSILKDKLDGKINDSFTELERKTGYSKRHLKRLYKQLNEKDIETLLVHGNTGVTSAKAASNEELEFYDFLKSQYPKITIAQFKDYVDEDYLNNSKKKSIVKKYKLVPRSYAFFQRLFKSKNWSSPVKHRVSNNGKILHLLRQPMPRRGMLVQIDGTPFDWLGNGEMWTLHLAVDDATSEPLAGWFTLNESQYGYVKMVKILLEKHGIPLKFYSDKHRIFKNKEGTLTQFALMMKDLGIEMIFANTAEAKGRIERQNGTVQNRLPNDIKRFKIKSYDKLNTWFNEFYCGYISKKFSRLPIDPNDEYIPLGNDFDFDLLFSWRFERIINDNNMFSYDGYYYLPIDEKTGEVIPIRKKVKVALRQSIETKQVKIFRMNKWITCEKVAKSSIGRKDIIIDNQKDLIELYKDKTNLKI